MPISGSKKRFGQFELDSRSGELRSNGTRIKLQGQPISVLEILLESPGELVTRDQFRQRLWSSDTFVDFDHNLNTAIKKLRQALGDEAETPRYIETIPRYGYRFIGQVEKDALTEADAQPTESTGIIRTDGEPKAAMREGVPRGMRAIAIAFAALILLALTLLARQRTHRQTNLTQRVPVRTQLPLNTPPKLPDGFAVSPDGQYLVYVDDSPRISLRVRDLRTGSDVALPGTEFAVMPFWSPDSRSIGFFSGRKLKKIAFDSQIVSVICQELPLAAASWGTSGIILMESLNGPRAISVESGEARNVFAQGTDFDNRRPSFLPDGEHFLFIHRSPRDFPYLMTGTLYMGSLDGGAPRSLNLRVTGRAEYRSGYLLYPTEHGLFAQRFEPSSGNLTGQPALLFDSKDASKDTSIDYTVSNNGILLSRLRELDATLKLYSRDGKADPIPITQGRVDEARFSPDGTRIAYDQVMEDVSDVWVFDLNQHVSQRITPGDASYYAPVWSPDGKQMAYSYWREHTHGVEIRNVDGSGSPRVLFETSNQDPLQYWPRSWGAQCDCLFVTVVEFDGFRKIAILSLNGDRKLHVLPNSNATSRFAQRISPDGKWLAYASTETGRPEIFVQPYPGPGQSIRVSTNGGSFVEWRKDGRELSFFGSDGTVETAVVSYTPDSIKVDEPTPLFATTGFLGISIPFDTSPDGKRFAITTVPPGGKTMDVIVNWDYGLPD